MSNCPGSGGLPIYGYGRKNACPVCNKANSRLTATGRVPDHANRASARR